MPSYTPYFGLAMFNLNDNIADLNNVQKETERFVIIDKQLYGLYSIFGDGVIDGWNVVKTNLPRTGEISVEIEPGIGIINSLASESKFQARVDNLPPNRTVYIYAQNSTLSNVNRQVNFFFNLSSSVRGAILLATVVTNDSSVSSIDNDVRTKIGFEEIIDQAIASHKHRGSPSKIDLSSEVKNKLPGSKISNLSAEKVNKGKLPSSVIPNLSHSDLSGIGIYTHAALDSLARNLSDTDDQLMGEVALVNQLRLLIYLKYKYDDVDDEWINTLVVIPGVSPDSYIDFDASDAYISTDSGCISGYPVAGGQTITATWDNLSAFNTYYSKTNINNTSSGIKIERADIDELVVEGFEDTEDGEVITSFVTTQEAANDTTSVTADSTVQSESGKSAKFSIDQSSRVVFTKTFEVAQDWTDYDSLLLDARCQIATHGKVYFYFTDSVGGQSSDLTILDTNEITTNENPLLDQFETRTFNISGFSRSRVTSISIYTEDVNSEFIFNVDNILLKRTQSYKTQGNIKFRYITSDQVVFNTLNVDSTKPSGTQVKQRVRYADSLVDLESALYSPYLPAFADFSYRAKYLEIDITLLSDSNQDYTPIVNSVELSFTASAEENGIIVNSSTEWAEGESENLTFTGTTDVDVTISSPIKVNKISFINENIVSEIDVDDSPVLGITGTNLPISEYQAWSNLGQILTPGFSNPKGLYKTEDRRFIISDTDNDRIVVFNDDNTIDSIYAGYSRNFDTNAETNAIPLTATYNEESGILYLGFSKSITFSGREFAYIIIRAGTQDIRLSDEGAEFGFTTSFSGRLIGIELSAENQSILNDLSEDAYVFFETQLSLDFDPAYIGDTKKITIYNAPIKYYEKIFKPLYALELREGTGSLYVAQANKLKETIVDGSTVTPVVPNGVQPFIVLSPSSGIVDSSSSPSFSEDFGGGIYEFEDGRIALAGVDSTSRGQIYISSGISTPLQFRILYISPLDLVPTCLSLDSGGYLWAGESSNTATAGRIIKVNATSGIVEFQIYGNYSRINGIQVLENDELLVST